MILHVSKNKKTGNLQDSLAIVTILQSHLSQSALQYKPYSLIYTHTHIRRLLIETFALSHIHSSRERSCFNEGKHPVNSRAEISSLPSGYLLSDLKWEGQICLGHINKNAAKCCMEFIPVFLLSLTNMFSLLPHFPQA